MARQKILIADDDESLQDMMGQLLQIRGFEVISVSNGKEAVAREESCRPDLIILDVDMPVMNGFEACRIIRAKRSGINYVPIIFVSGNLEEKSVISGLQIGADDYIRKPFEHLELINRINNLLKMKDLIAQLESIENIVFSMVKSIEARDSYTAGHSRRVANISVNLGREMGISEEGLENIRKGALLHDVGKIGVSDHILNKKGSLLAEEFDIIMKHPDQGENICSNLKFTHQILDIIRHHHEKLNGSGYPDKIKGAEIDGLVRIVTVADIFDALTTDRPYHPAKSNEEAVSILKQESQEGKLDESIVNCMEKLIQEKFQKEEKK